MIEPAKLENFYNQLNENQRQAVQNFDGPSLILAGAGSGKTRVLVYRIVALILEGRANLNNILAVTFTNKAAREMKERIYSLLQDYGYHVEHTFWIGTFHSVCAQLLRQNITLLPNYQSLTIYDASDQLRLVKNVMKNLNIDDKAYPAKDFRGQINLCKRMAIGPEELDRIYLSKNENFCKVYQEYEKSLRKASAFDFESLLLETYNLLNKHPQFLEQLQNQFQYIHVDEYQDTNTIQYKLIKKLGAKRGNVMVVGDEDQSIYSWRGADISNIMDFEKDFKPCKTFFLEENYRSTGNIVEGASHVISNNKIRKGKNLFTNRDRGDKIAIKECFSEYEEGRFVAETIRAFCYEGDSALGDFTILYRTNAQSRALEDHFRLLKIPYKIVGGVRFYERAEVKDAIAYLKLILNTNDDISFLRIINSPKRGFGKTTLDRISQAAYQQKISFFETLELFVEQRQLKGKSLHEASSFLKFIKEIKDQRDHIPLYELYVLLLDKSKYLSVLEANNSIEAQSHIDNLQELGNVIEQKEKLVEGPLDLESFLEEVGLLTDDDKTKDIKESVTLMTLHNSKGLEFDTVFICGMENGLFPSFQSIEEGNVEEERRLAYVGMTRAMKKLILTFVRKRRVWGKDQYNPPSCFLSEIPEELIIQESLAFKTGYNSFNDF